MSTTMVAIIDWLQMTSINLGAPENKCRGTSGETKSIFNPYKLVHTTNVLRKATPNKTTAPVNAFSYYSSSMNCNSSK